MVLGIIIGIVLGILSILIACEIEQNYEDKKKSKEN